MAHFGDILAELRRDNNLTQKELANLLNISGSSISAYERGTRLPDIYVLELFSDFFNVSTDYLIGKAPYSSGTGFRCIIVMKTSRHTVEGAI